MKSPRWTWFRGSALAVAALAVGSVAAGCGSSGSDAAANGSGKGTDVNVTVLPAYPSELVIGHVISAIARAHPDLGVNAVKFTELDVAPSWQAIKRGDMDIIPEADFPNQQTLFDQAARQAERLGDVFSDAPEGWFVPSYAVNGPNAPAAGLTSVNQLGRYKDVFGGALYDEPSGWKTTQFNDDRLKAFNLGFKHYKLDGGVLTTQIVNAINKRKPIVFFMFQPHWLFASYDLVQLKEPQPYSAGCFTGTKDACGLPSFTGSIVANKGLQKRAPRFYAMLRKVRISLDDLNAMIEQVERKKVPVDEVTDSWVKSHNGQIAQWIG
jgi:glycine betaine/proline transport system substrate-binding protein